MSETLTAASPARATWKDYVTLTKPRVISLLLFTALAAMFIASGHAHTVTLVRFMAVLIGGYAAAGAANTLNMVYDRDIDKKMDRTATRPTVTLVVPTSRALLFAIILELVSFSVLAIFANPLAAWMALSGLAFYVVIYTMILKRRTWHNIVIGGAAGAFPPLVGVAAVTNHLGTLSLLLFLIIFVWTPVHFWALALLIKDDYAAVGVPMLPVVKGDRATVIQIIGYAVVTLFVAASPYFIHMTGVFYLLVAVALSLVLLQKSCLLLKGVERKQASGLFHFSMIYLAILFLAMAVDRMM